MKNKINSKFGLFVDERWRDGDVDGERGGEED
jgi:hypothetical protein